MPVPEAGFNIVIGAFVAAVRLFRRVCAMGKSQTGRDGTTSARLLDMHRRHYRLADIDLSGARNAACLGYAGVEGFNFRGGFVIRPEFLALWLALSFYTSAFIAEIVRAGILAVNKGQWEAASALGLPRSRTLNLVIIPQALRVIVPPLTSQYLNLTKNSSWRSPLATWISWPRSAAYR